MRLTSITIEGFRSFAGSTRYEFDEHAGMFCVVGENRVEPSLGSNASGKSTFFDALCWCLYGKTARGLSGPKVESWSGGPGCMVEVGLVRNGARARIARTRGPIALSLDGQVVDQDKIDDFLGISYERFLHVVLMGQFGRMFPDMTPTERLNLLNRVLDLDVWVEAAKRASAKVQQFAADLSNAVALYRTAQAVHEERAGALAQAQGLHQSYNETRDRKLAGLASEYAAAVDAVAQAEAASAKGSRTASAAVREVQDLERELSEAEKQRRAAADELAKRRTLLDVAFQGAKDAHCELEEAESLRLAPCSLCKQDVPTQHYDTLVAALQAKMAEREEAERKGRVAVESASDHLQAAEEAVEKVARLHTAAEERARKLHRKGGAASSELRQRRAEADRLAKAVEELEGEDNPHALAVRRAQTAIDEAVKEEERAFVVYLDAQTQHDLMSYWPKGFKEIRLWVAQQALDELTVHVNASLVELGLTGWEITFRTTREGAKNGAFDILVKSPTSPDEVPWESWSGGETQRLRIACTIGLAELIRSRMPSPPVVEVWDEPTAHLNPGGVKDLIDFLSARADTRQVFVVDHRSIGSGAFDGTLKIVKTERGSMIES